MRISRTEDIHGAAGNAPALASGPRLTASAKNTGPRDRPILMRGHLVREALADRKLHTRRIIKPQPTREAYGLIGHPKLCGHFGEHVFGACMAKLVPCPYGAPGDRLWAKETHAIIDTHCWPDLPHRFGPDGAIAYYREGFDRAHGFRWRPSIHMPRWASRLLLEIVSVHVERLQDITEEDAKLEGVEPVELTRKVYPSRLAADVVERSYREGFAKAWREINGAKSWDENPWVWVIAFRRIP